MTNSNETQSIKLCFVGLPLADQATFERVISFCKARGQNFEVTLNPSESDALITDDEENNFKTARQLQGESLLLVVSNDKECTQGDIQLQRPLLVTRVMRTMESLSGQLTASSTAQETVAQTVTPVAPQNEATNEPVLTAATEPVSETQAPEPDATATETPEVDATDGYLALVIDDSAAIRKQLEIELRTAGLRCDFAESGEEALDKIQETNYDLIFLDIMMPGIDGYETCGKIRKDPRYKKTPVVMLSGKTAPLDEVKGVIAGASTYLTKPVKHDHFQRVTGRITHWLDEFR